MSVWRDLGLVFRVAGQRPWMRSHGYVPTALVLDDRIRVYAAFWDEQGVGRIGYVDLDPDRELAVLGFSAEPALDLGPPGCFDDHGVTPMSVIADDGGIRLYYAGWQHSRTARYLLFTGLARSVDGGRTFTRARSVPVIDRSDRHDLVRTGFIARHGQVWKAWLAQSDGLIDVLGKLTPRYRLGYLESADGIVWPPAGAACFADHAADVFGVGRSAVWRDAAGYHGMFSLRAASGYRIEYATSDDGAAWGACRRDGYSLLPEQTLSSEAETMFPSVVMCRDKLYAFYNGNGFGQDGIRCARWDADP